MKVLYHIKRFLEYLLYRIYRHGKKISIIKGDESGGYFYLLGVLSIIPAIIFGDDIQNIIGIHLDHSEKGFWPRIKGFMLIFAPIMLILSLILRHSYIKKLEYTKEESKLYRNVFLVFFLPVVFYVLYGMVTIFFRNR